MRHNEERAKARRAVATALTILRRTYWGAVVPSISQAERDGDIERLMAGLKLQREFETILDQIDQIDLSHD